MKIYYHLLHSDFKKASDILRYSHYSDNDAENINAVIIGDFICFRKTQYMLRSGSEYIEFTNNIRRNGINVLIQLPLIVKTEEITPLKNIVKNALSFTDGFIAGDLGALAVIDSIIKEKSAQKKIIFATNMLNRKFAGYLKSKFEISAIRPLMYKKSFHEEDIGFDKDMVVYGNIILNCSPFCLYSGDLPSKCSYKCIGTKEFIMQGGSFCLFGRNILASKPINNIHKITKKIAITSATIIDYNLTLSEIKKAVDDIREAGAAFNKEPPAYQCPRG